MRPSGTDRSSSCWSSNVLWWAWKAPGRRPPEQPLSPWACESASCPDRRCRRQRPPQRRRQGQGRAASASSGSHAPRAPRTTQNRPVIRNRQRRRRSHTTRASSHTTVAADMPAGATRARSHTTRTLRRMHPTHQHMISIPRQPLPAIQRLDQRPMRRRKAPRLLQTLCKHPLNLLERNLPVRDERTAMSRNAFMPLQTSRPRQTRCRDTVPGAPAE